MVETKEEFQRMQEAVASIFKENIKRYQRDMLNPAYGDFLYVTQDTIGIVSRYVLEHLEPGSFFLAVLKNDLMEAIGNADMDNLRNIRNICSFVYQCVPLGARNEGVNEWLSLRRFCR